VRQTLEKSCAEPDTEDDTSYQVAGRVTGRRGQGGIVFIDLTDASGQLQLVIKEDVLGADFALLDDLDLGDIITAQGTGWRTRRGELSLKVQSLKLLAKSLRPLPSTWHGLKDHEQRYRQRYVDLLINDETREFFALRSKLTASLRQHLTTAGYVEAETPTLEEVPGGADANPFQTHHDALDIPLFLRISLELHLKRLIVGGYEKVYELGRVFRNEGIGPQHLQEFTMLEFYEAYADYETLMQFVEQLYADVIKDVFGTTQLKPAGSTDILDFTAPWPRVDYVDAIKKETGIDVLEATDEEIVAAVKKHRVDTDLSLGRARLIDQLYKKTVRPNLKKVCFLVRPPLVLSPLAKPDRDDPRRAERFWVLAEGAEIGNGFSELNDPIDQYGRFSDQEKLRQAGDVEAQRLDLDYIRALQYGLPPTAGFGVGLDRWLYILTGQESIRDTVLFPQLRPEPESELEDVREAAKPLD
jgi:lysyl-tRNA synthetase class 2